MVANSIDAATRPPHRLWLTRNYSSNLFAGQIKFVFLQLRAERVWHAKATHLYAKRDLLGQTDGRQVNSCPAATVIHLFPDYMLTRFLDFNGVV